jgi:hypothetical protein
VAGPHCSPYDPDLWGHTTVYPHQLLLLPKHLEQLWHGLFGGAPVCDRLYEWADPKFLERWRSAKGEITLFSHPTNKKNNGLEGSIVFKQKDVRPEGWVRYTRMYGSTNLPLGHFLLCRTVKSLGLSSIENAVRWGSHISHYQLVAKNGGGRLQDHRMFADYYDTCATSMGNDAVQLALLHMCIYEGSVLPRPVAPPPATLAAYEQLLALWHNKLLARPVWDRLYEWVNPLSAARWAWAEQTLILHLNTESPYPRNNNRGVFVSASQKRTTQWRTGSITSQYTMGFPITVGTSTHQSTF